MFAWAKKLFSRKFEIVLRHDHIHWTTKDSEVMYHFWRSETGDKLRRVMEARVLADVMSLRKADYTSGQAELIKYITTLQREPQALIDERRKLAIDAENAEVTTLQTGDALAVSGNR